MGNVVSFQKAARGSAGKSDLPNRGRPYPAPGEMSALTMAVIVSALVGFAILHVVGAVLIASLPDRPAAGSAPMHQGDR